MRCWNATRNLCNPGATIQPNICGYMGVDAAVYPGTRDHGSDRLLYAG